MAIRVIDPDELWFKQFPERQTHIRKAHNNESHAEFMSLGPHDKTRRHILLYKVPSNNLMAAGKILKIPYLLFADESVRDEDETLWPIVQQLMVEAAQNYGIKLPQGPRRV